jgi:hypothetical protein
MVSGRFSKPPELGGISFVFLDMTVVAVIVTRQGGYLVALVSTVAYLGLEARPAEVQCQVAPGLPRFSGIM